MAVADTIDANREITAEPRVADYVVDADVHVTPPPGMWSDYLSPQFRALAPVVETDGEFDYIVFEGNRRKVHLMQSQAGRSAKEFRNAGRLSDMRVGGWMAPKRLEDMDRDGMDVAIVFGGGPLQTGNLDLYVDSFAAYNRWAADFCSEDTNRLKYAAFLPVMDVNQTIAMMRDAKRQGAVAVNIPAFPQSAGALNKAQSQFQALSGDAQSPRQYRDPEFDPLWAAAVELDMAITFHLGARVSRFTDKTNFLPDVVMGKPAMLEMPAIMIYGGVFDRLRSSKSRRRSGHLFRRTLTMASATAASRRYMSLRCPATKQEYATPVGAIDGSEEQYYSDLLYFYDDPHTIYASWPKSVWAAVDAHQPKPGMSELQTRLAVGQKIQTDDPRTEGNRTVTYDADGKKWTVTFVNDRATKVQGG